MQAIIDQLVRQIGSVNSVSAHINMCIMLRRTQAEPLDAVTTYLAHNLDHLLTIDQLVVFAQTILDLDPAIQSIEL